MRFLQEPANARKYGHLPIRDGLDAAFLEMPEDAARYCFHNCEYVFDAVG